MTKPEILVVGYGWASIGFIQDIDTNQYNVILISDCDEFTYTPLLAKNVRMKRNITIPITSLNKNIKYHRGRVNNVDFQKNTVIDENGHHTPFQYVIFAHGSDVNTFGIPGVKENALFLKTNQDSVIIRERIDKLAEGSSIVVIGCGLAGTELIGTIMDYSKFKVIAVDALDRPLSTFTNELSQRVIKLWEKEQTEMRFKSMVSTINAKSIDIKNQPSIPFDLAIWCGGIRANELTVKINKSLGLDCVRGIPVNEELYVTGKPNIFAIGDCAFSGNPSTAQVAYQEGKYLAKKFNSKHISGSDGFKYRDGGQIGYIGKGQSVYQTSTFQGGGKLMYYFNNFVHLYNFGKVYLGIK